MKIRTKLIAFPLISLFGILVLGVLSSLTAAAVGRALEEQSVAHSVLAQTASLQIVTYECLVRDVGRAGVQWRTLHDAIGSRLSGLRSVTVEEREIRQRMVQSHGRMAVVFAELAAIRAGDPAIREADTQRELEQRLASQLLMESQRLVTRATRQTELIGERLRTRQARLRGLQTLVFLVLFFSVLVASVLVAKSITHPLSALRAGVRAVGAGNLDYRTGLMANDEVGDLARAFDRMAADLKRITTSRDHLDREVHRRELAETSLRERSDELIRSNEELQQFAYVASHDLQEPLRKIVAFGRLLEEEAGDALNETARDYMSRIQSATGRMQGLIDDLLKLSRVATRGEPFVRVDLSRVAEEAVSDLDALVRELGGRVERGALPEVECDEHQMRQLFQNLISNGLKFHGPDASAVVKVYSEAVSACGSGLCRIVVEDNGIGFDMRNHERIFTIFQRLHSRDEYGGAGIGLAICRKILDRHGGTVRAESTAGHGARFIVTLPVTQGDNSKKETMP